MVMLPWILFLPSAILPFLTILPYNMCQHAWVLVDLTIKWNICSQFMRLHFCTQTWLCRVIWTFLKCITQTKNLRLAHMYIHMPFTKHPLSLPRYCWFFLAWIVLCPASKQCLWSIPPMLIALAPLMMRQRTRPGRNMSSARSQQTRFHLSLCSLGGSQALTLHYRGPGAGKMDHQSDLGRLWPVLSFLSWITLVSSSVNYHR